MTETKERILLTALELFARDGYEGVSVSDIAGRLGITKAALYKHFKSKRDIFDSIVARMEQRDAEQANAYGVPEGTFPETEDDYRNTSADSIVSFSKAMFRYWTQDEIASQFRKMLTLEQFRDPEMAGLYGQYLVSGPLGYMTDLFAAAGRPDPRREAAEFYAPMFFLYSLYDGAEDKGEVFSLLDEILENAGNSLKDAGKPASGKRKGKR